MYPIERSKGLMKKGACSTELMIISENAWKLMRTSQWSTLLMGKNESSSNKKGVCECDKKKDKTPITCNNNN